MMMSISQLCAQHEISIEQLTQRSGLDESRILAIALGRWTPSPAEREGIANVFGLRNDEIAWGHKTPIQHIYGHGPG